MDLKTGDTLIVIEQSESGWWLGYKKKDAADAKNFPKDHVKVFDPTGISLISNLD